MPNRVTSLAILPAKMEYQMLEKVMDFQFVHFLNKLLYLWARSTFQYAGFSILIAPFCGFWQRTLRIDLNRSYRILCMGPGAHELYPPNFPKLTSVAECSGTQQLFRRTAPMADSPGSRRNAGPS